MENLPLREQSDGGFSGSRLLLIAEITKARGKWIHEFYELTDEQQALHLAHHEIEGLMRAWYEQLAEDEAKRIRAKGRKR